MQWYWRYIWTNSNLLRTLRRLLFWSTKIFIYFINHLCFSYAWFNTSLLKVWRRLKYSGVLVDYMWMCVCVVIFVHLRLLSVESHWPALIHAKLQKIFRFIWSHFEWQEHVIYIHIYIYIYHILGEVTRVRLGMFNNFSWVSYIRFQLRKLQSFPVSYRKTAFTGV